jgi:hypothetical protein
MPAYLNGPFNPPVTTVQRGKVAYSIGGFNDLAGRCVMQVTADSIAANVASLNVTVLAGDPPAVGSTAFIQGTANSAGAFNSSAGVVITGSTFTGATGTITFALTAANQASTVDHGQVIVDAPETSESVNVNFAGKQFGIPQASTGRGNGDVISWSYGFPGTAPATVTVALQGADVDVDSQYTSIDTGTLVAGETRPPLSTSGLTGVNFLRVKITVMTGGPVAAVAKITV